MIEVNTHKPFELNGQSINICLNYTSIVWLKFCDWCSVDDLLTNFLGQVIKSNKTETFHLQIENNNFFINIVKKCSI